MGKTFQKTLINRQRARAQFAALSKKNQEVPEKPSPGKGLNRTSSKESLRSAAVRSSRSTVRGSDKSGTRIGSKAGSKRDYVESVSSTIGPVKIVVNQNLAMLSNRKASFEKALRSFNTDTDSLAKESKEKLLDDITDSTQDEHNIATHIPSLGSSLIPKDTKQISSLITNSRINSFASDITVPSLGPYTPLKPNDPPSSSRRRSRGVSYLPQNELGVALESPNESTSLPPESVDSNDFHGEFLAKILQVDEDNDRALLNSADRNYYFTLDGSKRSSLLADSDSLEVEAEIKLSLGESSENPVSVSESSEARRKKKLELVTCMLDRSYHNTSTELPSKAKVIRKTNTRDNEVIVGEDPFHDSNMDNSTLTVTRYFVSPIGTINR